jgi:hypothetical protein
MAQGNGSLTLSDSGARVKDAVNRGAQVARYQLDRARGAARSGAVTVAEGAKKRPVLSGSTLLLAGAAIAVVAIPPLRRAAMGVLATNAHRIDFGRISQMFRR